jgi:hypothetical protein
MEMEGEDIEDLTHPNLLVDLIILIVRFPNFDILCVYD